MRFNPDQQHQMDSRQGELRDADHERRQAWRKAEERSQAEETRENYEYLSNLACDLRQLEVEHAARLADPEKFLARVEKYLTEQTNRAYVAYYRAHKQTNDSAIPSVEQEHKYQHACKLAAEWTSLGDAREIVRRPLREMRGEKLKGARHIDGGILR